MAETKEHRFVSEPRAGFLEQEFLREQALFYNAMADEGFRLFYYLVPVCERCWEDLEPPRALEDHMNCQLICMCGYRTSTLGPFQAGRLAKH